MKVRHFVGVEHLSRVNLETICHVTVKAKEKIVIAPL